MNPFRSSSLNNSMPNPRPHWPGKCNCFFRTRTIVPLLVAGLLLAACDGGSGGDDKAGPDERLLVSGLEFADQNLAACVQSAAESSGWVYADEIEEISCFDFTFDIASLDGLEVFAGLANVSLRRLDLGILNAAVTDLSPLAGLESLTSLHLTGHSAVDITPLASLSGLRELELAGVIEFTDFGGCVGFAISPIDSFSPLAELSQLQTLTLYGCFATQDYSAINSLEALEELHLAGNLSLAELPEMDSLKQLRVLDLGSSSSIRDIGPIASLTALQYLVLPGDRFWGAVGLDPIAGLVNLRELVMEDSEKIVDLDPLAGLTNLESLTMTWRELEYEPRGRITDLTPLVAMQKLSLLRIEHQRLSDIGPLAVLPSLVELSLRDNQVSDISPLAGLDSVTTLDLYANPFVELDPLVGMLALERLSIWEPVSCQEAQDFVAARPDVILDYGYPCAP